MARMTGAAGAATIGGTTVLLNGWEFNVRSVNIESTAAGDTWTDRTHLRNDWTATIRCKMAITPPYDIHTDLVGTDIAIALKMKASDTNPIIADTGLVNDARITNMHDQEVEVEVEVISSDGSDGPDYDESPAS